VVLAGYARLYFKKFKKKFVVKSDDEFSIFEKFIETFV